MNSSKYPFKVQRVGEPESDYGQHKTRGGAEKRIKRIVAMSNGKLTEADFFIKEQ